MELNVLYTINNKYIDIMLVSLTSLILNNKSYSKINFFIVSSDFNSSDYKRIESYVNNFNNVNLLFYPIDDFDIKKFNIPDWRGNQIANARLFHRSIINDDRVKKLLYLDADTIVVDDLGELNNYYNKIMGVKDSCLKSYMSSLGLNKYYNSGVLLFDEEKWENDLCEERIINYLREDREFKLSYPDQDVLNLVLGNEFCDLDFRYNMGFCFMVESDIFRWFYFNRSIRQIDYVDVKNACLESKILHNYGCCSMKPWIDNKLNPLGDEFLKYMNLVNSDFGREELTGLKKVLVNHEKLFYTLLVMKSYFDNSKDIMKKKLERK